MYNLIENHFEKILTGNVKAAFSDYSKDVVCIAHVNGSSETLAGRHAVHLIWNLGKVLSKDYENEREVLVRRATPDYGVLTLKSLPYSPFLSYTCIVKNGKIAYMTLYVSEPSCSILPKQTAALPESRQAKKIFYRHVRAMFSVSARVISKDYADNGVVMTNMAKDTCNGKPEIYRFCDDLMKSCWKIIKELKLYGFPWIKWRTKSAEDGLFLFVCEAKAFHMVMTETYRVENGKIQFESAICGGEMPALVQKIIG